MRFSLFLIIIYSCINLSAFNLDYKKDISIKAWAFSAIELNDNKVDGGTYSYLDNKRIEIIYSMSTSYDSVSVSLVNKEDLKESNILLDKFSYKYNYQNFRVGYLLADLDYSFYSDIENISPKMPYYQEDMMSTLRCSGALLEYAYRNTLVSMKVGGNQLDTGIFDLELSQRNDSSELTLNYICSGRDKTFNQPSHHLIFKNKNNLSVVDFKVALDFNLINNDYLKENYFINNYFGEVVLRDLLFNNTKLASYIKYIDNSKSPLIPTKELAYAFNIGYRYATVDFDIIHKKTEVFSEKTNYSIAVIDWHCSNKLSLGLITTITEPPYGDIYYDAGIQAQFSFN